MERAAPINPYLLPILPPADAAAAVARWETAETIATGASYVAPIVLSLLFFILELHFLLILIIALTTFGIGYCLAGIFRGWANAAADQVIDPNADEIAQILTHLQGQNEYATITELRPSNISLHLECTDFVPHDEHLLPILAHFMFWEKQYMKAIEDAAQLQFEIWKESRGSGTSTYEDWLAKKALLPKKIEDIAKAKAYTAFFFALLRDPNSSSHRHRFEQLHQIQIESQKFVLRSGNPDVAEVYATTADTILSLSFIALGQYLLNPNEERWRELEKETDKVVKQPFSPISLQFHQAIHRLAKSIHYFNPFNESRQQLIALETEFQLLRNAGDPFRPSIDFELVLNFLETPSDQNHPNQATLLNHLENFEKLKHGLSNELLFAKLKESFDKLANTTGLKSVAS